MFYDIADTESMENETSQSLLLGNPEILRVQETARVGDIVKVYLRQTGNDLITSCGRDTEISTNPV